MVQKGYILLSGILLLGLFMFMSTIITLENYQQQPSSSQQQHSFYQTTSNHFIFPFSSTSSSNTTSTSNITISSSYDPFLLLKSFLFNSSTATLTSHSSSTTTISDPIYPSYLSYVQNKTLNLWNNVNNQINKLYHYTTWNITESSNSSLYELQLVNIFASQGLGNLRGISNSNPTISDLNHEQNQQQLLSSSSEDQSTGIKLYITQAPLHPAVPVDLEEEESESMLKESSCHNNTFQPTCAMYPYVQFWKQKLNYHDCHRVRLSLFV